MPKSSQQPQHTLVSRSLSTAGPVTPPFPAPVEQNHFSSAAPTQFTSALLSDNEYTSAFHSRFAHIETRSSVVITPSIVGPDLVASKDHFPAGNITIPVTPITDANDETAVMTIAIHNQVSSKISMRSKPFQSGTVFPL
jgi:hypothetical protein